MTILVTGAAGFVAHHLASLLRQRTDARLVGVDVRDVTHDAFNERLIADLSVAAETRRVFEATSPNLVFHLAGLTNGTEEAILASNLGTVRHLIDVTRSLAPETRIVFLGSAAEYGNVPVQDQPVRESFKGTPQGAYGKAKSGVSALVRASSDVGLNLLLARPFNVVGAGIPRSLMVGAVVERVREAIASIPPHVIRVGNTTAVRDFIAVEDVVDGLIRIAELGRRGEAYNLCSGVGVSVAEVVGRLIEISGESIQIERDPALVRAADVGSVVGSWEKARVELDWAPTVSLDVSLRAAWEATAPVR